MPVVTLVIHGTGARESAWWRLGGGETFADRLETKLAAKDKTGAKDMTGTVWRPALDAGMAYEDFSWSGANRHKDRMQGARRLRDSLGDLADNLGATADDPLEVNLVGHSHGGNVALEAIEKLPDNVRARRLTMLGTPLVWRYPSGRLYLLLLATFFPYAVLAAAIDSAVTGGARTVEGLTGIVFGYLIAMLLLFGPYLLIGYKLARWMADRIGRLFGLLRRGRNKGLLVYGPRVEKLPDAVGAPPTLFTTRGDEADLVLHLGASPTGAYDAFVKKRLKGLLRWIEPLWIRGYFFVYGAPVLETVWEHKVLGFPWRSVLFSNYEMVSYRLAATKGAIRRIDVSAELVPALRERLAEWRPPPPVIVADDLHEENGEESKNAEAERSHEALRRIVENVVEGARGQLQLRHTVYYETESLIDRVAGELVADPAPAGTG